MIKKDLKIESTGSTPYIMLGLGIGVSIFPNSTSAINVKDHICYDELVAIECLYNPPMKFSTDDFLESIYRVENLESPKFQNIELAIMNIAQKFASEQIELDDDFTIALDELFANKIKSKPTKRRFN